MHDTISTKQARSSGITRGQLRTRAWIRVGHGLYRARGSSEPASRERQMRDLMPALERGEFFAHLNAAELYGLWLPPVPRSLSLQVSLPPESTRPMRPGVYAFRSRAGQQAHRVVRGLPAVTPQVCIGQLAEDLSVLDLTIAIDSALQMRLCSLIEIQAAIRRRQRGLPRLRRALVLCDQRSESAWETILRLIHVTGGIDVDPQARIRDEFGQIVARADLRIRGTCRLAEYDGAVHRDRGQHESDLRREKALTRLGFERYGYIASEIVNNPRQVIRDAEKALHIPHDLNRLIAWHELAHPSSLTKDGLRRYLHRLHRFD